MWQPIEADQLQYVLVWLPFTLELSVTDWCLIIVMVIGKIKQL